MFSTIKSVCLMSFFSGEKVKFGIWKVGVIYE